MTPPGIGSKPSWRILVARRSVLRPTKRVLDGILFDAKGRALRTTYASKSIHTYGTTRTKGYYYYMTVSFGLEDKTEIERLSADEIERVVMSALKRRLADARWLAD